MVYADYAATTPLCEAARAAMEPWISVQYGNPSGQYREGSRARRVVERARRQIAERMGCQPEEILFTSGGSEGNSWAVWNGALRALNGSRLLLTTPIEHHSLLNACGGMEKLGVRTRFAPVDPAGHIIQDEYCRILHEKPALVSLQYANNEVGTVQDIPTLAALCRETTGGKVLFHTDAVQAVGHLPLDLTNLDLLTASAHKFGGPKGTGFLYVRRGTPMTPLIFGGSQEQGLRGGTENVAGIAGMAAALAWSMSRREAESRRLMKLTEQLRTGLAAGLPDVCFPGDPQHRLPGLVSVILPHTTAEQMVYRLDAAGIAVSAGAACDQRGRKQPSHVLTSLGISAELAQNTLRISLGAETRAEDVEEIVRQCVIRNA